MKKLPLLLLLMTIFAAAWAVPAVASSADGAQDSEQHASIEGPVAGIVAGTESARAPEAEVAGPKLDQGQAAELPLFQSFERKLEIIAATAARGCAIMACDSHDDCRGNGSCHQCCFGICMAD